MTPAVAGKNFPFIVLSGPKLDDPKARRIIRKQAMKDVGENRKRKGNFGRINLRQLPVSEQTGCQIRSAEGTSSSDSSATLDLTSPDTSESSRGDGLDDYDEVVLRKTAPVAAMHTQQPFSFAAINLFSNYETARSKFRVDLTELSILTNFNVDKSTIPILTADPARLGTLLDHRQWSYLQFVPSLYGTSPCLTSAANCLLGKVKDVLFPEDQCKEVTMRLYAKALRSLQDAIGDGSGCMDAEVLCATQLLSLHELLDPSRDTAYTHHINGSARLVKHRSPERFTTEFDKALFAAHVGPIVSESLVDDTHCYLEQPEWSALYQSLIQDSDYLDDRNSLTIHLRMLMFPLPGLWHDVGEAIAGPQLFDDTALQALERRCRKAHRDILNWLEEYKSRCVRLSLTSPPQQEIAMRRELFGSALECLSIVKRILASVCDEERESLEVEAQALAHLILDLQKQPSPKHSWLFSKHEVGVAYTIMLTKGHWEGSFEYDSEYERRMALRTRYNTWSNTLRMTG
ncbi:hypothetical protein LTR37_019775 [Vermiconidia calcicola]|uniref:Uncharacterized protein n=1 Tax=Vermiconidia calcicola TaxID=1690605 RepID=A0ACC3MD69_9PEZI|nr:hypothetical protein LTR37_019775 [Vermiconidia calcicola]